MAQIEDIFLNDFFHPTSDSTQARHRIRNVQLNGVHPYTKFLPDSSWINTNVFTNSQLKRIKNQLNFNDYNFLATVPSRQSKIDSIPYTQGEYTLTNKKGKTQVTLKFYDGYIEKVIFYHIRKATINEVYDFSPIIYDKANYFFCYSGSRINNWTISLVTINANGQLCFSEIRDISDLPRNWKK